MHLSIRNFEIEPCHLEIVDIIKVIYTLQQQ